MALRKLPLVVIIGATGSGKSKLAIELAKRFNGQVIGADSMQVYKGLDIATNKVTKDEMDDVKHHLISTVDPSTRFSVIDYKHKATEIIDSLMRQNILPILVGGTQYYIESVLWKNFTFDNPESLDNPVIKVLTHDDNDDEICLMDKEDKIYKNLQNNMLEHTDADLNSVEKFFKKPIVFKSFTHVPSVKLWSILEKVDPEAASAYHPNNKRRIIRSLQVYQSRQQSFTQVLKEKNKVSDSEKSQLGGPLRYTPTCVFWLSCDKENLDNITKLRVDDMIERGLIDELEQFNLQHKILPPDSLTNRSYEKGILQTIGYKEFANYLNADENDKYGEKRNKLIEEAAEKIKIATRQYAKRQVRWIKRRLLLSDNSRELPTVFELKTCVDEDVWKVDVLNKACEIVEAYEDYPNSKSCLDFKRRKSDNLCVVKEPYKPGRYFCDKCDKIIIGNHSIESHLNSRVHRKKYQVTNMLLKAPDNFRRNAINQDATLFVDK